MPTGEPNYIMTKKEVKLDAKHTGSENNKIKKDRNLSKTSKPETVNMSTRQ